MSKRLKAIVLVFVSLGVLLILISFLAATLIDLNKYREMVARKIEETLHRKAYIGQIQHTLWTGLGAEINGVTILNKDGSRPFIEAEQVITRIRLIPLLRKKIEVSTLVLKNPKIFLERAESGVWNFEDILPVTPTTAINMRKYGSRGVGEYGSVGTSPTPPYLRTPPPPYPPTQSFWFPLANAAPTDPAPADLNKLTSFSIHSFKIVRGTITIQDRLVNKETTLSNITLEAQNIAAGSQVPFRLFTEVNGENVGVSSSPTPTKIDASGTLGPLSLNGSWRDIGFDLKARLEEFILSRFAPYYKKQLGAELIGGELDGEVKLSGKLGSHLTSEGQLEVTDFLWKDPKIFTSPLKGINATVNGNLVVNFLDNNLKLIKSSLIAPALSVDVTGEVQDIKTSPELNLSIKLENLVWDKFFALLPPETLPNLIRANGRPPLLLDGVANMVLQPQGSLKDLTLTGTVNLGESYVQYRDLFLKPRGVPGQIAFQGHLSENALTISSLTVNLNNMQMDIAGTIGDLKTQEPTIDLRVTSQPFLLGNLLELFPQTRGSGAGNQNQGKAPMSPRVEVSGPGSLDLVIKGKPKDLLVKGSVSFDQSELVYGTKIHKAPNIPAHLEFSSRRQGDELNLENLTLQLGALVLEAIGTVKDFTSPFVRLDLATNKFTLEELHQQLTTPTTSLLPSDVTFTGPTELRLHAEGPMDALQITTHLDLTGNGIKYKDIFSKPAEMRSDLRVDAGLEAGQLNVDNVVLSLEDMVVKATGTIGDPTDPDLDLQVDTNTFDLNTLLTAVPIVSNALPEDLTLAGKASLSVKPKGKPEDLNITGNINLDQAYIQYGQIFKKPEGIASNVDFNTVVKRDDRGEPPLLNISSSLVQLGNLALRVNGSIASGQPGQTPLLNLNLSTNPFDMGEFQSNLLPGLPVTDLTLTGASQLQAHVEGSPRALEIKSQVNLTKSHLRYKDFFAKPEGVKSELAVKVSLSNGDISIKDLTFLLEDLELKAKGTIMRANGRVPLQTEPRLNLEALTNEFNVEKLLQKVPVARASLPPDLNLTGPGKLTVKTAGVPSNLHLSGLINMDKGEVSYGNMFKKASGIPGRLEFDTVLKRNRFEIETLKLNINDVILDIKGFVTSFEAPRLDLRLRSNTFALNQLAPPRQNAPGSTLLTCSRQALNQGLSLSEGKANLNLNLKGKWEDITTGRGVTGTINFKNVQLALPELSKPVENLTASAVLADGEVAVKDLTAQLGSSILTGSLNITDLTDRPVWEI